jgi:hypothetical protein
MINDNLESPPLKTVVLFIFLHGSENLDNKLNINFPSNSVSNNYVFVSFFFSVGVIRQTSFDEKANYKMWSEKNINTGGKQNKKTKNKKLKKLKSKKQKGILL